MNYQRIYNQIIDRSIKENRIRIKGGIYYENHHIIPKCLGGLDIPENLVLLTLREHFLVHWLLTEIHPENYSLCAAFYLMANINKDKISSRMFVKAKIEYYKRKKGIPSPLIGRKLSEELKKRLSEIRKAHNPFKGQKHTNETKAKMRNADRKLIDKNVDIQKRIKIAKFHTGRTRSQETKDKIKEAIKDRVLVVKLSFEIAENIRKEYNEGKISQYKLAKKFNVSRSAIQAIILNKVWKGIDNRFKDKNL